MVLPEVVPTSLIRAFKEQQHLECFLSGKVRMGRLDIYRVIEDPTRQDETEGEVRLIVPGVGGTDVHYGGSFHNPVYLLCCSEPLVDEVSVKPSLGKWIAYIKAPASLLSAMSRAVAINVDDREIIDVMLLRVCYSKGCWVPVTPSSDERYRLMLAQKNSRFEQEREWRYALVLSGGVSDSPRELWLDIDNMGKMANRLYCC